MWYKSTRTEEGATPLPCFPCWKPALNEMAWSPLLWLLNVQITLTRTLCVACTASGIFRMEKNLNWYKTQPKFCFSLIHLRRKHKELNKQRGRMLNKNRSQAAREMGANRFLAVVFGMSCGFVLNSPLATLSRKPSWEQDEALRRVLYSYWGEWWKA